MKILKSAALAAATALVALPAATLPASAADGFKVGVLTCEVTEVTNLIVYTDQSFDCTYDPAGDGATESYTGQIDKIGIDLSIKSDFTIVWAVLAPTEQALEPGALAGTYAGAAADVAVGQGVGAAVLVGGGNSVSLQPVSVSGVEGAGVSLGIETFELTAK
jgi:hypothetical protein